MKILHVVTLVSPDGAYGGPVRVATNQAATLQAMGHDVTVAAATRGYDSPPTEVGGVPARLFPAQIVPGTGFAGLTSIDLFRWFRAHHHEFDVVHVHLARDLVTLPVARWAAAKRTPLVVQPHGMIDPTGKLLARPIDALLTRPVLRLAHSVFHLTDRERADLIAVAGPELTLVPLFNGVPPADSATGITADPPEVLFLARLHPRKRASMFVEVARTLLDAGVDARFSLVGPDEGDGNAVHELIAESGHPDRLKWSGPVSVEGSLARMGQASLYVLPSVDEPFPMSVLEAMSVGLPVVVTDTCGLAPLILETGAGVVVDSSEPSLREAVRSLLADTDRRRDMGRRGRSTVRDRLTMNSVAAVLGDRYDAATR